MAKKQISESQQSSQGITIGSQGNQGGAMPAGAKGTHHKKQGRANETIPNQEKSSANNAGKKGR